ncbi:hypothetical protein [Streptomyces acidicola]
MARLSGRWNDSPQVIQHCLPYGPVLGLGQDLVLPSPRPRRRAH